MVSLSLSPRVPNRQPYTTSSHPNEKTITTDVECQSKTLTRVGSPVSVLPLPLHASHTVRAAPALVHRTPEVPRAGESLRAAAELGVGPKRPAPLVVLQRQRVPGARSQHGILLTLSARTSDGVVV